MIGFLSREFTDWALVHYQLFRATIEFQLLLMYELPVESPWTTFDHIALDGMPPM
ncbi:hypothetical protein [Spirosoma oryzicola]|uniref:hypothetical protein n=1 Tax=Spirosoma oryzicola TaxID=2898794 RepID=UPI001E487356|nr:hypothetical protein [Spirosoma oryzicola]UHG93978.1 hypothetical protein LQ777_24750 [Spirosoma oryzicola]